MITLAMMRRIKDLLKEYLNILNIAHVISCQEFDETIDTLMSLYSNV